MLQQFLVGPYDTPAMENNRRFSPLGGTASDCWGRVHPALAFVPLWEEYSIAYGAIVARKPGREMEEFLDALRERFTANGTAKARE